MTEVRPADQLDILQGGYSLLMCSCKALAVDEVRRLVDDTDVHAVNLHHETALHITARNSYIDEKCAIEIAALLVAAGADVNARAEYGLTPLMYAAIYGTANVVQFLLEHGANVNLQNDEGFTILSMIDAMPSVARRAKRIIHLLESADGVRSPVRSTEIIATEQGKKQSSIIVPEQLAGDHAAIIGQWKMVAAVQDQNKLKHPDIGKVFEFTPQFFRQVGKPGGYEYDLYENIDPKAIDLFVSRIDGMVIKGIYELENDDLKILLESTLHDQGRRPSSMNGLAGHPRHFVSVYRRKNR